MPTITTTIRRLLPLLLAVALLGAGCGGDDGAGGAQAPGSPAGARGRTTVKVGILPVADLAPLFHAVSKGYFAAEGLDVSMEIGQGGAALVPAVTSGQYQFAFGNYVSLMLAQQHDVGVQVVANVVNGAERADRRTNALLVRKESGIRTVADLAGKTFAVTTLGNAGEVTIRTTLRRAGVDDSGIKFVELPFPDMNAAVQAGKVDVAWQAEPFVTLGVDAGLVDVVDPMFATQPSMPLAGMFAASGWLETNADVAKAFVRALRKAMDETGDQGAMRAAIASNTKTPSAVVPRLALANWQPTLDRARLAEIGSLAVQYHVLDQAPDINRLVWTGA